MDIFFLACLQSNLQAVAEHLRTALSIPVARYEILDHTCALTASASPGGYQHTRSAEMMAEVCFYYKFSS